jgi:ABC-type transport system involved in cytochrome c biogenesis permease subunit
MTFLKILCFPLLIITLLIYGIQAYIQINKSKHSNRQKNLEPIQDFLILIEKIILLSTNLILVCLLILRWVTSHHLPLSNLYESLLFLTWSLNLLTIIITNTLKKNVTKKIGIEIILYPIIILVYGFANFLLPPIMQKATPLVPALQSNWLIMHVSLMMFSYTSLIAGSLVLFHYKIKI